MGHNFLHPVAITHYRNSMLLHSERLETEKMFTKNKNQQLTRFGRLLIFIVDQPGLEICRPKGDPLTVWKKPGTSRL